MSTSLYAEQDADFRFKGDEVTIDGTLTVVGDVSMTGAVTLGATAKTTQVVGPLGMTVTATGTTAGAAWTTGAPALTAGQKYILITIGGATKTTYRIPIWANS